MQKILWMDVETTGTDVTDDALLEVAGVLTCYQSPEECEVSPVVHRMIRHPQLSQVIGLCTPHVQQMHGVSGLLHDLTYGPTVSTADADAAFCDLLDAHGLTEEVVLGGNSVMLDREFIREHLPRTYRRLSHRSVDMTSAALLLSQASSIPPFTRPCHIHRAVPDVVESVCEYMHYQRELANLSEAASLLPAPR